MYTSLFVFILSLSNETAPNWQNVRATVFAFIENYLLKNTIFLFVLLNMKGNMCD